VAGPRKAPPLRSERVDDTVVLVFDRPAAKNAIDLPTMDALASALGRIEEDDSIRAVVLAATGSTFVSGGDIRALETLEDVSRMATLCDRLERTRVPVLAAVSGHAYGGGCEILVACDYRIAESQVELSFRQVAMGLTTGWGGARRLLDLVGRGAASRLLYTAQPIPAEEALRIGLFDEVVATGGAREAALAMAGRIARCSPSAVRSMKRALRSPEDEREAFVRSWGSPDHEEAVAAFREKRPPIWRSR